MQNFLLPHVKSYFRTVGYLVEYRPCHSDSYSKKPPNCWYAYRRHLGRRPAFCHELHTQNKKKHSYYYIIASLLYSIQYTHNLGVFQIMIFCCQLLLILGMRKQASRWIAVRSSVFILEMEMNQDTLKKGVIPPVVIGRRKRPKTILCIACFI